MVLESVMVVACYPDSKPLITAHEDFAMLSLQHLPKQLIAPVAGAVALGALNTLGDWIWAHFLRDGAVLPGVLHGVVIFAALAFVLAASAGTRRAWRVLLPSLPLAGLVIAAAFYPIAMAVGYLNGLLVTWVAMWLSLALLQRIARDRSEQASRSLLRGGLAAVGSGLAFWAVSGMWTQPSPTINYAWHFLCWTFAFLPGFCALLIGWSANETDGPSDSGTV